MRIAILLFLALVAWPVHAAHVPFVGCPSDGQQGPRPAPRSGATPDVGDAAAARLAWYADAWGTGVLAPRGWHCLGAIGSNGESITVAPGPLDWTAITSKGGVAGPAVALSRSSGGTSGRFEVAAIAARMFPAAKAFVARVEAEHMGDRPSAHAPYPADRITRRGPWQALFTTPAGKTGLGADWTFAPGALPVDGVAILHPDDDMDLDVLRARLPKADRPLVAAIIADVRRPIATGDP